MCAFRSTLDLEMELRPLRRVQQGGAEVPRKESVDPQWFSTRAFLSPWEHLLMSGDVFGWQN